ncbi:neural cell adhesion molecule 1-like isoform X2 [Xyrauchen texanus]|uniref:neural cell adhesion molecule 1-like isoform X2 n=1 Tax=Xyrauchen texanus TaxID=154827 RepID=UPI0022424FEB|nr:neural cell adhesion molecule 1-like isoform X2 [Xyrauchen texanus]
MLQIRDLIWTLVLFGYAAALQVEITPAQGEISVGESKFFLCEVVGDAKEIDWYAPNGEKLQPGRTDISVSQNDESSSTLTIYNANIDHAGMYKCVAKNGDKESQGTIIVKIFQKLTFQNAPSPQEFNEGDDADIICDVISSPPPTIIWKYKSIRIQPESDVRFKFLSNNHLQIRGIKKTDEGHYTCEGRIMARGEIAFRVIMVIVNVVPSIRTRYTEFNATANISQAVTLACHADGYPEPTVTWARGNVVLESGEKYSLNEDGSELTIKDVKKVDEGEYKCIAGNKAGERSEEVSLNVFVHPKITFLDNQTATEFDEQIKLTCEATGDPTPNIIWSFGRRVFTENEQSLDGNVIVRSDARVSSLTLKYVQFTDAGQYLCTARNSIGQDIQSMYLEVRYAPKIQGPAAVFTWEGNPANITCEALAHPGATILWFHDGQLLPSTNTTNVKIYNMPTVSFLEVNPESQNDFGNYNCTATNVIGTESREFILIQADVPSAPSIERVEPYSSTANLEFDEPASSGGVPILEYKAVWRIAGQDWINREFYVADGLNLITITGLKPETVYEVKMAAINGKGEGESSPPETFKTQPVREPNSPKLEAKPQSTGNEMKVHWIKQDDGGSPIKHYLVRYKATNRQEWKPEIRLPNGSEYVVLRGLEWNTEYEVNVVAENQRGRSEPGTLSFRTFSEPTAIPEISSGLGTGAIVGILIVVFILLLFGVDVTCYFLNKCGLLMCIAVNFCGKSGHSSKDKDIEEGKAAFTKDESKEPIVEVRTEEEHTPNHEGGGTTEPNETTPLTDHEHAADTTATIVDLLPSVTTNSDPSSDSHASDSTTLTSSTAPAADPKPAPQSSIPKASVTSPTSPQAAAPAAVAPLVDLSDTPSNQNSKSLDARPASDSTTPTSMTPADLSKAESTKPHAGEPALSAGAKGSTESTPSNAANPPQTKDSRVQGGDQKTTDSDLAKNVFDALAKPTTTASSTAPNQDDGKIAADEKSKVAETEVKKPPTEVKTVPNEAPQTNGNESKA